MLFSLIKFYQIEAETVGRSWSFLLNEPKYCDYRLNQPAIRGKIPSLPFSHLGVEAVSP